jgi:hypothetical protein
MAKPLVFNRMRSDRLDDPETVVSWVATSIERFAKFVAGPLDGKSQTARVYLVDESLIAALGRYSDLMLRVEVPGGQRNGPDLAHALLEFEQCSDAIRESLRAAACVVTDDQSQLFGLARAQLLAAAGSGDLAQAAAFDSEVAELSAQFGELRQSLANAAEGGSTWRPRNSWFQETVQRLDRIREAGRRVVLGVPHQIELLGFDGSQGGKSGFIIDSLPALEAWHIEAPAVLISPTQIERWSRSVPAVNADLLPPARRFELALDNVVAHELGHAMLRANKAASDHVLTRAWSDLYENNRGLEEGFCNFVGTVSTAAYLGVTPTSSRRAVEYRLHIRLILEWTYASYYQRETRYYCDTFDALDGKIVSFATFASLFSTSPLTVDWPAFISGLAASRLVFQRSDGFQAAAPPPPVPGSAPVEGSCDAEATMSLAPRESDLRVSPDEVRRKMKEHLSLSGRYAPGTIANYISSVTSWLAMQTFPMTWRELDRNLGPEPRSLGHTAFVDLKQTVQQAMGK